MLLLTLNLGSSGPARRVTRNGVDFLVAPITLLVPGVLPGSRGALFYPQDEDAKSYRLWDGMPLTLRHPTANDGRPVTARHPGVLDRVGLGHVKNSKIRPSDGAQVGEGWFDEKRVLAIDKWLHNALVTGQPVEVSTGLFTDNTPAKPTDRCPRTGRGYSFIARNYRPDHLAILPDQAGACSLRDGCGLNVNSRKLVTNAGPTGHDVKGRFAAAKGSAEAATRLQQQATQVHPEVPAPAGVARNSLSPTERMALLVNALDRLSPEKACKIVKDGSVRGHKLTKAQRGYFGAKCGERIKPTTNGVVGAVTYAAARSPLDVLSLSGVV